MTPANEILSLTEEAKHSKNKVQVLELENSHPKITIETLSSTRNELSQNNQTLQEKNEELEALNARLVRILYGRKSEKTLKGDDPGQHSLFEVPVQEEPEPEEKEAASPKKGKVKKKGPKKLPEDLPTKELILPAPEDQKVDAQGTALAFLGYEKSERLEYIAAQKIRIIIKREKWGYKDSREVISTAEPLKAIVPKGKFMDSFVLAIIFQKFFMGLPLYRQVQEHNAGGLNLAKSTLSDAVQHFGKFFSGTYLALKAEVFRDTFIHADETPIKCQKLKKGEMKKCYFWVFRSSSTCFFHFGKTRSAKELKTVFDFSTGPPGKKVPALLDKKE
jgi:transposase